MKEDRERREQSSGAVACTILECIFSRAQIFFFFYVPFLLPSIFGFRSCCWPVIGSSFRPILTSVKAVFDLGFYGSLFCRSRSRRCVLWVIKVRDSSATAWLD